MIITTLGTSHGAPEKGRTCSGTLVTVGDINYLFDCGGDVEAKLMDLGIPHESVRCIFVSHMHEDHAGKLTGMAKHFMFYNKVPAHIDIFLTEQNGIEAFDAWCNAVHQPLSDEKVSLKLTTAGEVYADEYVKVSAIATRHIRNGEFPSYAYILETKDKKILYTGDLACDFSDYPEVLLTEHFDAVVSELVHFDLEKNFSSFVNTKTDHLIFTHMILPKAELMESKKSLLPFKVSIAKDLDAFEV